VKAALVASWVAALLWLEGRRPLRRRIEPRARRDVRNLAFASLSGATIRVFERPVVLRLARLVERRRLGLLKLVRLPRALELALAVVLLDYTLYVWHVLTHRVPLLWRFHGVHHADLDLSATTAVRFHFGEMILSVPWRAAQVLVLGASPRALETWQLLTFLAILFHHSDVELPLDLEERLARLVVTPRLHGIHHSTERSETDSNWGTIFTWPDHLHGTARFDVPQEQVVIGSPDAPEEIDPMTVRAMISRPFTEGAPRGKHPSETAGR
jgi:sterol desaturase/sphingolipid hydroxylase (fatty acid hydroxylase superfamily)